MQDLLQMGRLSRHRKIKSCDPFFKGQRNVDISSNAPVRESQLDSQPVPRKSRDLFKDSRKISIKGEKRKPVKQAGNTKGKLDVQRKPGETKKEYFQRLDKQASEEVNKILIKEKRVSKKRKEFLKARKEKANKKRQSEIQEEGDKEFMSDKIKFGEVAQEPPKFTAKPKHASSEASKQKKTASLLLHNKLHDNKDVQNAQQTLVKCKRRKQMNAFEKQISDRNRQEAIAAYRKIKQKTIQENMQ